MGCRSSGCLATWDWTAWARWHWLRDSYVQGVGLGRGVTYFYHHPSGVQEHLHKLIHSASDTQSLHFVQEIGMPHSVEGPFMLKKVATVMKLAVGALLICSESLTTYSMQLWPFRNPAWHSGSILCFSRKYSKLFFNQSLIHFAKVWCEGKWPVACREVLWLSFFWGWQRPGLPSKQTGPFQTLSMSGKTWAVSLS